MKGQLSEESSRFIKEQKLFFISTIAKNGQPTVSYKGGAKGFVKVVDQKTIAYPGYEGNGMFLTSGNILSNPKVGLLFIDFENPQRLRVHGTASFHFEDDLLSSYEEAKYIVRINITCVFDNCSRYIHKMQLIEESKFVPRQGCQTPVPGWKLREDIKDTLP